MNGFSLPPVGEPGGGWFPSPEARRRVFDQSLPEVITRERLPGLARSFLAVWNDDKRRLRLEPAPMVKGAQKRGFWAPIL